MSENDKQFWVIILPALFIGALIITGLLLWEQSMYDERRNEIKKSVQDDYIYEFQQMDCEELQRDINTYQRLLYKERPDSETSSYDDFKWQQNRAIEEQELRC